MASRLAVRYVCGPTSSWGLTVLCPAFVILERNQWHDRSVSTSGHWFCHKLVFCRSWWLPASNIDWETAPILIERSCCFQAHFWFVGESHKGACNELRQTIRISKVLTLCTWLLRARFAHISKRQEICSAVQFRILRFLNFWNTSIFVSCQQQFWTSWCWQHTRDIPLFHSTLEIFLSFTAHSRYSSFSQHTRDTPLFHSTLEIFLSFTAHSRYSSISQHTRDIPVFHSTLEMLQSNWRGLRRNQRSVP
jgi:hypothetical protein